VPNGCFEPPSHAPHGNFRLAENFVGHWRLAWRARLGNARYTVSSVRNGIKSKIRTTGARGTFWKHLRVTTVFIAETETT
jgi:hypothetical protein